MASVKRFQKLLDQGDVVGAVMAAPFGYTSTVIPSGFRFSIDGGASAEAPTFDEAVRAAWAASPRPSTPEGES